jgi:hypothetical protein
MAPRTLMPAARAAATTGAEALDALGDGAVDVALAEGLAGGAEHHHSSGRVAARPRSPFMLGVSTE